MGGGGAALKNDVTVANTIPQVSDSEEQVLSRMLRDKERVIYQAPVEEVSLNGIRSMQDSLDADKVEYFASGGTSTDVPVILSTNIGNVVLDGNHRVAVALDQGRTSIQAHHVTISDLQLPIDTLEKLYGAT